MVLTALLVMQAREGMQEGNAFAEEWVAASSSSAASAGTGYEGSEQVSLPRLPCECDFAAVALQCTNDK